MGREVTTFIHLRNGAGVASCGVPATQRQLADTWAEVTCPQCCKAAGMGRA